MLKYMWMHGWEIAVILRNFRKTKLSKSKKKIFFNSISTYIQCATRRLSLCDIRKYRFPAFYGTSDRQAAIFFWTRMIQTMDPCSICFCSSVKPKFFTPTHVNVFDAQDVFVWQFLLMFMYFCYVLCTYPWILTKKKEKRFCQTQVMAPILISVSVYPTHKITSLLLGHKVNGVRWHQCTYCTKEFKKPSDLVRHIRIHTHEKPYKCTQCFRAFAVKSTLTAHIKTHSGVKDYRCDECNKLFSTQGSLKVHLRLHTGRIVWHLTKW